MRIAKLYTGGFEVIAFDRAWHGMTGGAAANTYSGGRKGYGPAMAGVLTLPTPYAFRSPFAKNGAYDWQAELDWAFETIDRQSVGRSCRGDHRADRQLRRHHRVARRLCEGAQEEMRRARHPAGDGRSPDRPRPHRHHVRVRARRRDTGHPHALENAGCRPAARGHDHQRRDRAALLREGLPLLHDPCRRSAARRGRRQGHRDRGARQAGRARARRWATT